MKPKHTALRLSVLCFAMSAAHAAPITRSNTADNLNLAGAWTGGVLPTGTAGDTATWDASSTLTNTVGASLTWGALDTSAASSAVTIAGATNQNLTLDHVTDTDTVFNTGANDFTWGAVGAAGNFNIVGALSTVAPGNGNTNQGATFSGSAMVTLSGTGTKNWSTSGNATSGGNGVTQINFTGTLALRGATIPTTAGTLPANWLALGGGGGAASANGTTVQAGSFALDTGDATSCGSFILTQGFSGQFLKLNRLGGTGSIRTDWGISAGTQTRGIELDQAVDTTLSGSILVHNGSNQRRNIQIVKKGAGTLTLTGALGSSQTAGGALASLNFDLQGGAIQIGDGTTNLSFVNQANWDPASTFVVGTGTTLRFKTSSPFTWSRAISGGSGTIELTTDGDPGEGAVTFSGNSSGFAGNIHLEAGSLRMGPNLGSGTLKVRAGTYIAPGLVATGGTTTVGGLELAGGTESDFRLGTTSDRIDVTAADGLTVPPAGAVHTINLYNPPVRGGAVTLIDYSGTPLSQAQFDRFVLGALPGGLATLQLVNNTANTSIDLLVTLEDQVWQGGVDGNWDAATTNWALAGSPATPAVFSFDNPAVFNDTATTTAITVDAAGVYPLTVLFDNTTKAYALTGGEIGGSTPLVKRGTGSLTLSQTNSYTGGTTIHGGTVVIDGPANNTSGGVTLLGGALRIGTGGATGNIGAGAVSIAAGTTVEFNRSNTTPGTPDLDFKANARMRSVSGAGEIVLTGGHLMFNYTGAGLGFAEAGSWAGFSGNLTVKGGSEFLTIRNGATAMGTGDVILGDATTSGALSQIEGNWTWTNDIVLVGSDNRIRNRSLNAPRALKLQGVLTGAGAVTFEDLTAAMTDANRGFILTADNTLTGTLTIAAATPLRVGGIPGNIDASNPGLLADNAGTLGAATVVNHGTLTFARKDAHTVANAISGDGSLRIGIPAAANLGDTTTQSVTYTGACSLTGTATVNNGSLIVAAGASLAASQVTVAAGATISGTGTVNGAMSCAGIIAPGAGISTFAVTGNTAVSGTLAIEVDGTADKLVVTGDLDLTGSTVTVAESGAGLPENGVTIASCTGTLTGLPTAPAGYAVRAVGNEVVLLEAVGYDAWKTANAGGQGPALDFDQDGVPNGVEYFMGETGSSFTANPAVSATGTTRTVTWKRNPEAFVTSFAVQVSTDLVTWTSLATGDPALDLSDPTQVKLVLPGTGPKTFCRLSVTP